MSPQSWPKKATLFEVGPRDGLQSEDRVLDLETRVKLVLGMVDAGLKDIEIGSFVRSDLLPQVAQTAALLKKIKSALNGKKRQSKFWAFIPNEVGLNQAIEAGIDGASFFVAASETFCQKNVNRSRSDLLAALPHLLNKAKAHKMAARVYLSTIVYCPYEGIVDPKEVTKVVETLWHAGAREIVLSDTTGDANPRSLHQLLKIVTKKIKAKYLTLHLHDTRGLALVNILEGMRFGISRFDSSIGGMGGCPYAPGASGNLATEDLLNMLLGMGLIQGVDLGQAANVGYFAEKTLGKKLPSRILRTLEKAKT
jgi:hydroxymethylglutaryl-CoA lyase